MSVKVSSTYEERVKNAVSASQDYELWALLEQACHMAMETRERELIRLGITGV